ncbi:MAG TPA: hypothetical protein VKW09_06380 [bacterium]|nr:hypothetical protein [bacterium]
MKAAPPARQASPACTGWAARQAFWPARPTRAAQVQSVRTAPAQTVQAQSVQPAWAAQAWRMRAARVRPVSPRPALMPVRPEARPEAAALSAPRRDPPR